MEKSNDSPTTAKSEQIGSEADFLADRAAAVERALSDTLIRMRADLGESADLAAWARRYPWPTMGIAAAAGFLAVTVIGSSASTRSEKSSPAPGEFDSPDQQSSRRSSGDRTGRSLLQTLMSEILRNFATAAQGALLAAIGSRFQPPPAATDDSPHENAPPVADPTSVSPSDGNGLAAAEV